MAKGNELKISQKIPDAEALLAMNSEELSGVILEQFHSFDLSRFKVHRGNFTALESVQDYPDEYRNQCQIALMEAWSFLEREGVLIPEPGSQYPVYVLSRLGQQLKTKQDFSSFLHARLFPRGSLHPTLVSTVFSLFLSGDYETVIFKAYKLVEVAVRDACGSGYEQLYGVDLMRKAFHPDSGPLTDSNEPKAERESLMFLFSGAIGRFKNPSSHRHVPITDPAETIEMLQFASHLLRIVDDKKPT